MKKILFLCFVFILGCASVTVKTPKEPIKIDITMRLDIYQHIQKDIDTIENMVSGEKNTPKKNDNETRIDYFLKNAYAEEEGLDPEIEKAVLRRKARIEELNKFKREGVIGENRLGFLEIRNYQRMDKDLENLVNEENKDRMVIYEAIAKKNNVSIEEVQRLYAQRLQKDSPSGTPIEVFNESAGNYEWKFK